LNSLEKDVDVLQYKFMFQWF